MTAQRLAPVEHGAAPGTETPGPDVVDELRSRVTGDLLDVVVDLDSGEGCRLSDLRDGTRYLDMTMYFSSAPLGHGHPGLRTPEFEAALVRAGRTKPANPDFATVEQARFVETLRRVFGDPELPWLFFIEGGGPAVENALKVAFDWKTKHNARRGVPMRGCRAMHLRWAFHGRTGYTMSLTNTDPRKVRDYPAFDWPRIPSPAVDPGPDWDEPELLPVERDALDAAEAALTRYGDEIACFVYEPIQGEGGDRHLRPAFLREMQRLCQRHHVLTVADEVQSGGGITGFPWAYQALGLEPDLVAFGKRLQVCGVMGGRRVNDIEDNAFREPSRISSTWGGSLVDMVRATRILEVIESEGLLHHAARMGELLLSELRGLAAEYPELVHAPRGRGLMAALDFPDGTLRDRATALARQHHHTVFLPSGPRSLRWRPALSVRPDEITDAVVALRATLRELSPR
ncbi:L-lysine 6-transaminase [Actinopolyspora erythraea]|uniref:L-lysine-epsilon aminotransferase n=1 Tax=Actinopolyspora erythraea TaxID=414996 RepID=A0A099D3H6_9ACTN|nr:L-lysine 6-transaminase [Actinopolyspora erythraea]ASU77533.1 L-lysine 6-transaminase [Actinopolyspora erythraea]KGI80471.1 L-lysine aminotransferase [Actinopolyspora erythraea]